MRKNKGLPAPFPYPPFMDKPNLRKEVKIMRTRKQALRDRNIVGVRVELARKRQGIKQKELLAGIQAAGVDMNASALSKLEGQTRCVTDIELTASGP